MVLHFQMDRETTDSNAATISEGEDLSDRASIRGFKICPTAAVLNCSNVCGASMTSMKYLAEVNFQFCGFE